MAGDIPQAHRSPEAMIRCLVSYIADDRAVRRIVSEEWDCTPSLAMIKRVRERHLRRLKREIEPYCPHEGYHPSDVSDAMAAANEKFLARLKVESEMSSARRRINRTTPKVVNHCWDRLVQPEKERAA